jgi:hypothetical protein
MMRSACLTTFVALWVGGVARADTITLNPTMIANLQSGNGQNNGGGPILIAASGDANQGLLSFDLSSVKVAVAGATLKLYQASNIFDTPPPPLIGQPAGSYDIYRNTSPWQQNTVTWNTKPGIDPASAATLPLSTFTEGWRSWDVTSLANAWITGPSGDFGLTIGRSDPGTPGVWLVTGQTFQGGPEGPVALAVFAPPNPLLPQLILDTNAVAAAPEPASLVMAGIAALGLIGYRRRRPRGLLRGAA